MSSNRRPWYPWYPKDFVVDEKVQSLSDDAELVYRRVLDILWQANALQLPSNCQKLANALARNWSKERFKNAWDEIQTPGFELLKTTDDGSWVYSERLKAEAQKIENISKMRSKCGKKAKGKQKPSKSKAKAKQKPNHTDPYSKEINKEKFPFAFEVKVPLPKNFHTTDDMRAYADSLGYTPNPDEFTKGFILSAESKGYKYKNWHSAWKTWLRNERDRKPDLFRQQGKFVA